MRRRGLWLVVALCLLLVGCARAQAQPLTIRIGILQVPDDVAIARQKGYFKALAQAEHVKIRYIPFDSGVDANKALMAGSIDAASMGDTNALVALSAGIDAKLVWLNSLIGDNEALVAKPGISSIQSLRGKKIATPFASTSHYSLMMVLKQHHLLHQVTLIDMDTQDIVAAWQRGDIDAAYTWQPTLSALPGKQLTTSATQAKRGNATANVLLMRGGFLRAHPRLAKAVIHQLDRAHRLYQTDRAVVVAAAAKQIGITQKAARQQLGTSQLPTAAVQRRLLAGDLAAALYRTGQFMAAQQTIDRPPTKHQLAGFIQLP